MGGPHNGGPNGFAIRAALSYYSCPKLAANEYTQEEGAFANRQDHLDLAVDFGVAVLAWNTGDATKTMVAEVSSPNEVNEVIWFSTTQAWDKFQAVRVEPQSWTACPSSFNPENQPGEPVAWAEVPFSFPAAPVTAP
jgi:hypothetical protein